MSTVTGWYCAGCGETTRSHAPGCPSQEKAAPVATAGEVAALRGQVEALIEHGQAMNKETDTLRSIVNEMHSRIEALEMLQKDPAER